jgi:cytolysin (calcineurin-like family phosphatase)
LIIGVIVLDHADIIRDFCSGIGAFVDIIIKLNVKVLQFEEMDDLKFLKSRIEIVSLILGDCYLIIE